MIERSFKKIFKTKGTPYLACNDKKAFFTSKDHRGYTLWSCRNLCDALSYLLDNIYIRVGLKQGLYIQNVGIPMGIDCVPLVADLLLFCYERDFMTSLSDKADIIEAFNSSYLDLLNIDYPGQPNLST